MRRLTANTDEAHVMRVLTADRGEWSSFMHGSNIAAIKLHAAGSIERRPFDRPQGGFEYRFSGRAA